MATKWISPTGNNASAGTIGAPWQTLAYALAHTSVADTIVFLDGLYTATSETITNRELASENKYGAVIDWENTEKNWTIALSVSLFGLKFINAAQSSNGMIIQSGAGLDLDVERCWFKDCLANGYPPLIRVSNDGNLRVLSTLFDNCGRMPGASIGYQIGFIYPGGVPVTEIKHCVFWTNRDSASKPTHCVVIYGGSPLGDRFTVQNNIFANETGIDTNAITTYQIGAVVDHNCMFNMTGSSIEGTNYLTADPHSFDADPLFVDAANGNFNLREGSPCLDAGTNL